MDDLQLILAELLCLVDEDVIELHTPELAVNLLLILRIGKHYPATVGQSELMVASAPASPQFRPLAHVLVNVVAFDLIPHPPHDTAVCAGSLHPTVKHDAL